MSLVFKARRPIEPRPELPLTALEREVANIIRTATEDVSNTAMSAAVRNGLELRNYEEVVNSFRLDEIGLLLEQTDEVFAQAIVDSIGQGFPKLGFAGRFDYTDPRAIEWAKNQSATLVTAVTDSMRKIIRTTIAESFTQNITVRDTAKKLSRFIGLNDRQAITYAKFETQIAQRIAAKEITEAQASKMLERQYMKMIKYRSQMIARQEIAMAEANGRYLGFTQAVENGWAHPKSMKRWSASSDERTCEICGPMNGKSVQWDQPFPNGVMREPAHVQCRCTTSLLEPDSKLAQDFMEPAKIVPPTATTNTPIPALPSVPVGNLKTPQEAIDEAHTNESGLSTFQYDAGEVENLNVTTEAVIFNGSPHTEIRFKLTENAKTRLTQAAERSHAKDDGVWNKVDEFLMIDRKVDKKITFKEIPKDSIDKDRLRRSVWNSEEEGSAVFADTDISSKTYTRYMPDGTAIRFVVSDEAYAFNGQVRVMIPGKATPAQVNTIMKELEVTANRLPSVEDIENLKKARLISLFTPKFGTTLTKTPAEINKQIAMITKNYKFTLDEVTTEINSDGALRFLLPERVALDIMKDSGVNRIIHSLGNYFYNITQEEKTERVVSLFTGKTKLLSNIQRKNRGNKGQGISEGEDIKTGGADYVFVRPSEVPLDDPNKDWGGTLIFNPVNLIRRTDWFAYAGDSYGVKNPKYFDYYANPKSAKTSINYFDEITRPTHRSEMMYQDAIDMKDLHGIALDAITRDEAIKTLKGLGITEWNGRKIEDVIQLARGHD